APDAWRLAVCIGLGDHDIVNRVGIDPGLLEQRLDDGGSHVLDRQVPENSAEAAYRAADRGDYGCAAHIRTCLNSFSEGRERARQGMTGSGSWRWAPPDRGVFRGTCAPRRTPRRSRS